MKLRPFNGIVLISLAMLGTGIVQGVRGGFTSPAALLLAGSLASIVAAFCYSGALAIHADSGRASSLSLVGLLPYAFGCYLLFYRGLWTGRTLLEDFSFGTLLGCLLFVYFGYRLVYWTWLFTELGEALRSHRLVVTAS